jgi:large subunit ribosomal protein L17
MLTLTLKRKLQQRRETFMGYRKLGRTSSQRKAMLRDLTTDLIINERIQTTETRAKELRSVVEKMITLGKRGDLHARRQAAAYIRNEVANAETNQDAVQKLFGDIAPRYVERQGGYTRIMKLGPRRGDGAPMVIIELV